MLFYNFLISFQVSGLPTYADPNMQPRNGHVTSGHVTSDTKQSSIMAEDTDQGYATLSDNNGHIPSEKQATLNVTDMNTVDKSDVTLSFNNPAADPNFSKI